MMTGRLVTSPRSVRGFDCNVRLSARTAAAMRQHGYAFAVRYVRRGDYHQQDLGPTEVETIIDAGLALMCVQHVESATAWTPSAQKGVTYGRVAVDEMVKCLLPQGALVWCDLEGVDLAVPSRVVDAYARAWYATVASAGYRPGLYVGWRCGLDAQQLYALPFTNYWAAYNLDGAKYPARVGVMMQQGVAKLGRDWPPNVDLAIDTDEIIGDKLGRLPTVYAPRNWPEAL